MSETPTPAVLTPSEWKFIQALRQLPADTLRGHALDVFTELLFYVDNPRCQGVGAEGFPCGEPKTSCDECHQVWNLLEVVAQRVG